MWSRYLGMMCGSLRQITITGIFKSNCSQELRPRSLWPPGADPVMGSEQPLGLGQCSDSTHAKRTQQSDSKGGALGGSNDVPALLNGRAKLQG